MLFARLARIALLPVLLGQGLWVRARADFLPEPPGARTGTCGAGPGLRLLVVGDSSAAGVGASSQMYAMPARLAAKLSDSFRVSYQVEAVTGATTRSVAAMLDTHTYGQFDLCVLVLGVNDVTHATSSRRYLANLRRIESALRTSGTLRHIVYSGLPPMGHFPLLPQPLRWVLGNDAARLDRALRTFCAKSPDRSYLPLDVPLTPEMVAPDGFHPSEPAHEFWAGMMARHIKEIVPKLM